MPRVVIASDHEFHLVRLLAEPPVKGLHGAQAKRRSSIRCKIAAVYQTVSGRHGRQLVLKAVRVGEADDAHVVVIGKHQR